MKKSLIAASASAVALAAMPVIGVFAVTTPADTVEDTLELNVTAGCTMTRALNSDATAPANPADKTYSFGNVAAGHTAELTGETSTAIDAITVSCNSGTWNLQAAGSTDLTNLDTGGTGATASSLIQKNSGGTAVTAAINSSTSGGLDGSDSEWAFKIANVTGSLTPATGYDTNYQVVPTSATTIGTITTTTSVSFTPNYKVSVGPNQAAGNYSGAITYSVAQNS